MALPTQATCAYSVKAVGVTIADLHAAFAAVAVDQDFLNLMSLTVASDNTADAGSTITRTIVLHLNQPPFVAPFTQNGVSTNPTPPLHKAYKGTIRSTSANDKAGGTGARTVNIAYRDTSNMAQTNMGIALDGTSKVSLVTSDHSQITSITIASAGADGANDGDLIIEDDGTTVTVGGVTTPVGPVVVGYAPASFYTQVIPQGGTPSANMIGDWMRLRLQNSLKVPVTVAAVVYA